MKTIYAMKTIISLCITSILFAIFLHSTFSFSQKHSKDLQLELKEKECIYTRPYNKPTKINFVFTATQDHSNYYFADLKEHIYTIFHKNGISVIFMNGITDGPNIQLKIDNSRVVDENEGYDKEIRYELEGMYAENGNSQPIMSFKIVVNTIHDINQQNKQVTEYLLQKVMRL
ncbi:hypothetical protein [Flavobacterium sp. GCM10027622]|uniref:hypothetical protein n=1 Tax=unclassified Flavobacterium TaxID=196869 RepID=UPI003606CAFA